MNSQNTQIAVIGAGSAGLAAFREAQRRNQDVLLIDPGPLGTTCARTGCMPSKVLIHAADTFYRRRFFEDQGIRGGDTLDCRIAAVLQHVRALRDRFAGGMVETTQKRAGDRLISGRAELLDEHRIQAGTQTIDAEKIIIATGAEPVVPAPWKRFGDRILTSATIFEQESLPPRIAVIGLGPIGLELGQALHRLGLDITGFSDIDWIGGLSDPQINRETIQRIGEEFPLVCGHKADVDESEKGELVVRSDNRNFDVDAVLAAVGISPNLKGLGLENLGIDPNDPPCDPHTGQLAELPVYVVGDANGTRPILHEALDEGTQAAAHALGLNPSACRCRRVPLNVVFSDPEIAVVGTPYSNLPDNTITGVAEFDDQSRAIIEHRNAGRLHLYIEKDTALLQGAEICGPDANAFGHLLALAIQRQCTLFELLQMPFYHPTLMEALRTALHDAAKQCDAHRRDEARLLNWCCVESPLN